MENMETTISPKGCVIQIPYEGDEAKKYTPEYISSLILSDLKKSAQNFFDDFHGKVEAVITVPASFDDLQRRATKNAAEIAGNI